MPTTKHPNFNSAVTELHPRRIGLICLAFPSHVPSLPRSYFEWAVAAAKLPQQKSYPVCFSVQGVQNLLFIFRSTTVKANRFCFVPGHQRSGWWPASPVGQLVPLRQNSKPQHLTIRFKNARVPLSCRFRRTRPDSNRRQQYRQICMGSSFGEAALQAGVYTSCQSWQSKHFLTLRVRPPYPNNG